MTTRDRLVFVAAVVLLVLGAGWFEVVSPKRSEATKLTAQVESARQTLSSAQSQRSQARSAQARYAAAYESIVSLGKAVPADQQVPSLIYELDQASNRRHVEFTSITTSGSGTGSGSGSGAGSGSGSGAASASSQSASGGFTQMPFTFTFTGSFADLYHLMSALQGFAVSTSSGGLKVSGRLLTIQSVNLAPVSGGGPNELGATGRAKHSSRQEVTGTITATAYVLPAGQGLTGGATTGSPATSASSSGSGSSSATSPAIVSAHP